MFKILLIFLCVIISLESRGQFESAVVGIDGLTCSMCQLGVQKSMAKLSFISDVSVDLNKNIATVKFKRNEAVSIAELAKSVTNAGFSVRSIRATVAAELTPDLSKGSFILDGATYFILDNSGQSGKIFDLKFVDRSYSDSESYKKYKNDMDRVSQYLAIKPYYFVII